MSRRVLFARPGLLATEEWTPALLALWEEGGVTRQRAALKLRLRMRGMADPMREPRPTDPLLAGVYELELLYRHASHCRGGREGWE